MSRPAAGSSGPGAPGYVLETDRLALRRLTAEDADFVLELVNDPDWLRFIGDRGVRSLDDARGYIEQGPGAMYARFGYGLYLVELKGSRAPIGICGLLRREWLDDADLGFAFLPRYRGQGYAREAATATLRHAREVLGLRRVLAIVSPENAASIRLLELLGLRLQRETTAPGDTRGVLVYAPPDG